MSRNGHNLMEMMSRTAHQAYNLSDNIDDIHYYFIAIRFILVHDYDSSKL